MALKILMVCLGNICRSPMAHGILQHKVKQLGLDWEIDSAGTSDWHAGELPDKRAIQCMKQQGIDITYQQSRPVSIDDIKEYDLIYAMDESNYNNLVNMAGTEEEVNKIKLLMSELYPDTKVDVPDPYYGGDSGFDNVYKMLDRVTDKVIEKYRV